MARNELHTASTIDGNADSVRAILASGRVSVDATDAGRRTPLHLAACRGDVDTVKVLLSCGASIDAVSSRGMTPFHYAIERGSLTTVTTLLDAGADVNATCGGGRDSSALHIAAGCGHVDVMMELLARGADVDKRDAVDEGPFKYALESARAPEALRVLLDAGADPFERGGGYAETLLHVAAENEFCEHVFAMLVKESAGLDVNAKDDFQRTPLHVACASLNEGMVAALLRQGADETVEDQNGQSLAEASSRGALGENWRLIDSWQMEGTQEEGGSSDAEEEEEEEDRVETARRINRRLAQASADRTWYRRSWLVMLRYRRQKRHLIESDPDGAVADAAAENGLSSSLPAAGNVSRSDDGTEGRDNEFRAVIDRLTLNLQEDGVFREVVKFV